MWKLRPFGHEGEVFGHLFNLATSLHRQWFRFADVVVVRRLDTMCTTVWRKNARRRDARFPIDDVTNYSEPPAIPLIAENFSLKLRLELSMRVIFLSQQFCECLQRHVDSNGNFSVQIRPMSEEIGRVQSFFAEATRSADTEEIFHSLRSRFHDRIRCSMLQLESRGKSEASWGVGGARKWE